jgi:hypothetical protein
MCRGCSMPIRSIGTMDKLVPNAIIPVGGASPVAFENVYEEGDRWDKVVGCEGCHGKCCGNCPHRMESGECPLHIRDGMSLKPLYCIVKPVPSSCIPNCQLVFRCVKGTNAGKLRYVCDRDKPFREEGSNHGSVVHNPTANRA